MKELEKTPNKVVFTWAALASLIIILLMYVFYFTQTDQKSPLNYLSYIPFIAGLFMAVKSHRDTDLGGYISFKRAFSTGFRYSSLLSLMMGLFMIIYLKWLNPEVLEKGLIEAENQLLDKGTSTAQIDTTIEMAKTWGPYFAALSTSIMYTLTGAVVSLIFAYVLKNESPMFENSDIEAE